MRNLTYIIIVICYGCTAQNRCVENSLVYLKFEAFIKHRIELGRNGGYDVQNLENEKKLKRALFARICNQLSKDTAAIIIEKVPLSDPNRFGIVLLPSKGQMIYFAQDKNGTVQVGNEKNYNYEALKKILDIVKPDFYTKASQLTKFFSKRIVMDAPSLNLLLLEEKEDSQQEAFYAFKYMPDVIMNENFDSVFSNKYSAPGARKY